MVNWLRRNKTHFIYWGVLIVYLLAINPVYNHFFVKNGKPIGFITQLPQNASNIIYNLVVLRPIVYKGENLYELKGFAFLQSNPMQVNRITIVLNTNSRSIAFSTNTVQYPDMIESYPGFKPGMEQAEFSMLISKNVLSPGVYRIGVLLEDLEGSDRAYALTTSQIRQTPNTINFIPGQ